GRLIILPSVRFPLISSSRSNASRNPGRRRCARRSHHEAVDTGEHPGLEKMRTETPQGVLDMLRLPGLRPDRIKKLYGDLGIASVADLEEAARSDRLKSTKGFGPAFQTKVL